MGRTLFKVDDDLYVEWGSITESPLMWGTREQVLKGQIEDAMERAKEDAERRLQAADEHGSSSFPLGTPDSKIFQQKGTLLTLHLKPFIESYNVEDGTYDESWIEPFDDPDFTDRRVGRAEQAGPWKIEVPNAADLG